MSKFKVFGHKPKWVQGFYNVFGSKLQKQYDQISNWEDPVITKFCKDLTIRFPKIAQKAMEFVISLYVAYGREKAHKIVKKIQGDLM